MTEQVDDDGVEATLAAYEQDADLYVARTPHAPSPLVEDVVTRLPPGSSVLELGSGPGLDALALEAAGMVVRRTDGARSFVERLGREGHPASVLDLRAPDFGGPFDAVFANAVLLHVPRRDLCEVLSVARRATRAGGLLAATFKRGEGEGWSARKLRSPRHFTYWDEGSLGRAATVSGWTPVKLVESTLPGAAERWITLVAVNEPRS